MELEVIKGAKIPSFFEKDQCKTGLKTLWYIGIPK